jgi:hypothetical protein
MLRLAAAAASATPPAMFNESASQRVALSRGSEAPKRLRHPQGGQIPTGRGGQFSIGADSGDGRIDPLLAPQAEGGLIQACSRFWLDRPGTHERRSDVC